MSQLRSVIASLYVIYVANNKQAQVTYSKESINGSLTSIKLEDNLAQQIDAKFPAAEKISSLVNKTPLFTAQLEALQVGIELFFHLAKINFVASGLSERTGSSRFQKKLAFATNMILVDLYLSSHSSEDVNKLLAAWLEDKPFASKLEDGLKMLLNTFTEETQYKIRDNNLDEIVFNQEGVYDTVLNEGEAISKDGNEPVGPFRIYKSYIASGMHPYLIEQKQEIKLNGSVSRADLENYAQLVSTALDITPRRTTIEREVEPIRQDNAPTNKSLQIIFYGAPGTGKSFEINKKTIGQAVVRTTFHPDSDYSTFVGAYKPTMEEVESKVVPVVVKSGISLEASGVYKEKRITYSFVKQAFLKAYLGAWKKYSWGFSTHAVSKDSKINVEIGPNKWWLEKVFDDRISYTKEATIELKDYEVWVKNCWNSIIQDDDPDNYHPGTFERYQATACLWYKEIESIDHTEDECWNTVKEELEKGNTINYVPGERQNYSISLRDGKIIVVSMASAKKDSIKKCFENSEKNGQSVRDAIAEKLKEYSQKSKRSSEVSIDDFDELWNNLKEDVNKSQAKPSGSIDTNTIQSQFLIIEEINRGNCAQIFGDLFQLLDRSDNGFSSYPIEADSDLQKAIEEAFKYEDEYRLERNLEINDAIEDYTSNYGTSYSLADDVQSGRVLLLPPNLYIWATMNTSDQSLFPIDSAFKRRWDWEYIPIKYSNSDWRIDIAGYKYSWIDFQTEINKRIFGATESEDKQLGDFFVKADDNNIISSKLLLNKVIFYLWNDVCKDGDGDIFKVNTDLDYSKELDPAKNEDITFSKFFKETDLKLKQWMRYLNIKPLESQDDDDEEKEDEAHQQEEGVKPNEAKPDTYSKPEYKSIIETMLPQLSNEDISIFKNGFDWSFSDMPGSYARMSLALDAPAKNKKANVKVWVPAPTGYSKSAECFAYLKDRGGEDIIRTTASKYGYEYEELGIHSKNPNPVVGWKITIPMTFAPDNSQAESQKLLDILLEVRTAFDPIISDFLKK